MADATHSDYSEPMLVCIQNCQDCHRACLQTLIHCMHEGGGHATADHLRLLMDCAEICATSANFMLRASDLHVHTCAACAEVCRRCAEDCARMDDDPRMKALADTCRHCAESCAAMAAGHGAARGNAARRPGAPRGPVRGGAVLTRRKTE
jgi:hypothetical protein